jgi:hypothetical protein
VLFSKYYYGEQTKEDEIIRACSTQKLDENAFKILVETTEVKGP